jgi:hypothetical protein
MALRSALGAHTASELDEYVDVECQHRLKIGSGSDPYFVMVSTPSRSGTITEAACSRAEGW